VWHISWSLPQTKHGSLCQPAEQIRALTACGWNGGYLASSQDAESLLSCHFPVVGLMLSPQPPPTSSWSSGFLVFWLVVVALALGSDGCCYKPLLAAALTIRVCCYLF